MNTATYHVVRQQDAHAWVEVHLPHSGWITMDPTPPSIESLSSGSPAWHALGRMMDTIRLQWSRFFVQYSAADQLALVRELKAGTSARPQGLRFHRGALHPVRGHVRWDDGIRL